MRRFSIMFPPFGSAIIAVTASLLTPSCVEPSTQPSPPLDAPDVPSCASVSAECERQAEMNLTCAMDRVCHCDVGTKENPERVACIRGDL